MKTRVFVAIAATTLSAISVIGFPPTSALASGESPFDSNFGTDGMAIHQIPLQKSESSATDIVTDSSGNIFSLFVAEQSVVIGKFTSNGVPVPSYGTNGKTNALSINGFKMTIQSDNKILVAGTQYIDFQNRLVVYRFTTSGVLDSTFGDQGVYSLPSFPGKNFGGAILMAVNNSVGRIHLGFSTSNASNDNENIFFLTLNQDGAVDENWGYAGSREILSKTGGVSAYTSLTSMTVLSDGSLLGVGSGYFTGSNFAGRHIILIKINPNGYLDYSFNGSSNGHGVVIVPFGSESDTYMTAITVLQDDSIVLAGIVGSYFYGPWYYGIAKFLPDGNPDTGFGSNGFTVSTLQNNFSESLPTHLAVQSNGDFVFPINSGTTGGFMRVLANGTISNSSSCSQCLWSGSLDGASALSLLVQANNKIVVSGSLRDEKNSIIRRFNSDGTPDSSFNNVVQETFTEKWESWAHKSIGLADGSIITFGTTWTQRGMSDLTRAFVMKFTANGSLDTQFGTGGFQFLLPPNNNYWVSTADIGIQPDGKIVVLGYGRDNSNTSILMWRLHANGNLDNTFGTGGLVATSESGADLNPTKVIVTSSGHLLVPLTKYVNYEGSLWLYKYTNNGQLEPDFTDANNISGGIRVSIGTNEFIAQAVETVNNSVYIAGFTTINSLQHGFVTRVLANGTLDTSFSGGYVSWRTQQSNSLDQISELYIDGQGQVFLLGGSEQPTFKSMIVQLDPNGVINTSYNGSGYLPFALRDPETVDYVSANSFVLINGSFTVVGGGDSDRRQMRSRDFSAVAQTSTTTGLNTSFGSNGVLLPFADQETNFSHISRLSNTTGIVTGSIKQGNQYKILLLKIGATTSTPAPAPVAPQVTPTPTPTPTPQASSNQTSTTVAPTNEINLTISTSQDAILKKMGVTVPKGGKVVLKASTPKICRVSKTKVLAVATGTCRVSATVTVNKKKTTKSTSFRIS